MQDYATLLRENAALRELVARQGEQLTALTEQLAKLNDQVAELLAVALRKQRKVIEPKPAVPPVVDEAAKVAFSERPQPPQKPLKEKPTKPKATPTGRKALPRHLEAEEHSLRPQACSHCGGIQLDAADEIVEEKLHVVKEHQRRRVVRRTTCRCRACGERTTPRSLPAPYERSKVTGRRSSARSLPISCAGSMPSSRRSCQL